MSHHKIDNIVVIDHPDETLRAEIKHKIVDFNRRHWPAVTRQPLAVEQRNEGGVLLAGACGHTFGHWLLLDYLWVDPSRQGKGLGSRLLALMESEALTRGCRYVLLDTLEFQARPFYEKQGYQLQWTQGDYPLEGYKYFMSKTLV